MTFLVCFVLAVCSGWPGVPDRDVRPYPSPSPRAGVVTVGEIPPVTVLPGDTAAVVIPLEIAEGFHVQANPASNEFLIPLEIEIGLEEPDSLIRWKPVYPAPDLFRLEGTTDDLLTYHGSIGIEVLFISSAEAPPGERVFTGTVSYQACDARRCLFPTTVPVSFKVVIGKRTAEPR